MSKRTDSHTISHAEKIFSGDAYIGGADGRGIPRASLVQVDLDSPIVADVNGYFAEDSGPVTGSKDFTLDGALASGGVITHDFPRGVQIVNAGASTSKITFYGTDQYGVLMSEEVLSNGTTIVFGKKAFKTITRVATDSDTTATLTAGSSDILGLPFRLENVADVVVVDENDANLFGVVAQTAAAAAAATAAAAANTAVNPIAIASAAVVVTNALNTITAVNGSGATTTQEGEIDALFAEIKTDLDANKVVVDNLVLESASYNTQVTAAVADFLAQKTELDKLIVDVEAIRVELNKTVTDVGATDIGALVKSDATAATDLTGDVRGTYNPTAVLDGTKNFKLLYKPQKRNTVGAYGVAQFRKAT